MIEHFYAHNFRCLVNFHLGLDEANVLLGANGSGKTSVLDALKCIQDLVVRGFKVTDLIRPADLAFTSTEDTLRLGVAIHTDENRYQYAVLLERDRNRNRMRISEEAVKHEGNFLYRFEDGPTQVSDEPENLVDGISLSENIARGREAEERWQVERTVPIR